MADWRPNWQLEEVPCVGGGCTPQRPSCPRCVAGKECYEAMSESDKTLGITPPAWHELEEWKRESWRQEAAA